MGVKGSNEEALVDGEGSGSDMKGIIVFFDGGQSHGISAQRGVGKTT